MSFTALLPRGLGCRTHRLLEKTSQKADNPLLTHYSPLEETNEIINNEGTLIVVY